MKSKKTEDYEGSFDSGLFSAANAPLLIRRKAAEIMVVHA